jgi:polysaccharide export outer membrane protein
MFRTVIAAALFSALPVICLGNIPSQEAQEQKQQQQQPPATDKKPDSPASPVSVSPLIPVAPAGAAGQNDAADPSKTGGTPAHAATGAKPAPATGVDTHTYDIGAEDVLTIIVFEGQQFSTANQMVRPDGKITLPLLGEFQAAGITPEKLETEISDRLQKDYMNVPPHVNVIVNQVNSKHYFINGEVNRPGRFNLVVPTTVSHALTEAGGFRDFAKKTKIRIQHADGTTSMFNYKEVEKGKNLKQDIYLKPGDAIYVD